MFAYLCGSATVRVRWPGDASEVVTPRRTSLDAVKTSALLSLAAASVLLLAGCASGATSDSTDAAAPDPSLAENRSWSGELTLNGSALGIELDGAAAPQAVASFVQLAEQGYFDATSCHRLTTAGIYVLQCGDPTGTGTGGPGYSYGPIENAPADDVYAAGVLAMARRGGDGASMGSQFFIVYQDSEIPSDSAGGYTVLGTVTSGLDVVTAIAADGVEGGASDGTPADPAVIDSVSVE
ncbi:peptidylprolyl isomerase [Microbacteriaceae bacterium VKM Ac-2854]|nr:peptidylprolyl isomerase [Microbacteriaceae bacterium VKM Ac-2854]